MAATVTMVTTSATLKSHSFAFGVPPGCPFHPRCPHATDRCKVEVPSLRTVSDPGKPAHTASCHYDL